ncbi:Flp family type IVb pilin [Evansella sp. AB-P1]|nr:Flp family type IVb pilin [Evansella sp. AB-P1]MDG5790056.1 Flp family type IVb pilin [Evansella sp. AB-P1]
MLNKLKGLVVEEEGQGMAEYALVLGVIAVGVIAVLAIFGRQIVEIFDDIVESLRDAGFNGDETE